MPRAELWLETRRNGESRFTDLLASEESSAGSSCAVRDMGVSAERIVMCMTQVLTTPRTSNLGRVGALIDVSSLPLSPALHSMGAWSTVALLLLGLAILVPLVVCLVGLVCVCRMKKNHRKTLRQNGECCGL